MFTAFCVGFAFAHFSEKVLKYRFRTMQTVFVTGIIIATVYAKIFSIFYRVNVEANIILLVFCAIVSVVLRKEMRKFLQESFGNCPLAAKILIPLLFLLWAYYTSRGYRVPDMNLYHGQSIRWIEEYGVVKGLGNLHYRFGYNSSLFAVSALYSMKFILGRSMHAVNGLLAFLMTLEVLKLGRAVQRRRMRMSDYARVGLFYYMSLVWDEIVAPSSDYAVMFMLFFVVIKWLSQLEAEDDGETKSIAPYALLCVAGVYTLTLKVTAGLILILVIKPAYQLIREKRWKEIAIYLSLGLVTAVPWLVRNVIITGWLLYPFPAIDLFDVEWKMTDIGLINSDAAMIKVYAKGARELGINATVSEWFPGWFANELSSTEKLLILGDWAAIVLLIGIGIWIIAKKQWNKSDMLLVLGTVCASFLFWQFSAPMMRYGYAHALLLAVLAFGYLLENIDRKILLRAAYGTIALFVAYRAYMAYDRVMRSWWHPAYIWQETYETQVMEVRETDGVTFYFPVESGLAGYEQFPAGSPAQMESFSLLGDDLEDGFRCITSSVE